MRTSRTLIIFLLRCWVSAWLWVLPLGWFMAVLLFTGRPVALLLAAASISSFAILIRLIHGTWRPNRWLWPLSRRVVGFRTIRGGRVSLLFPAGLDGETDLQEVTQWAEEDLDDLARLFRLRLRRRLVVVLVPGHRDLTADFGRPMGGVAIPQANAVVLAVDCPLRESLRHEIVHLFAARWNLMAHHLLQEGLAVWLQGAEGSVPVEEEAGRLIRWSPTGIGPLLDRSYFFAEANQHRCYLLAGGFAGFLIRRFGWDRFRDLYRRTDRWTFRARFKKRYGLSPERAWGRWHDEAVTMEVLRRRLREDRLFN